MISSFHFIPPSFCFNTSLYLPCSKPRPRKTAGGRKRTTWNSKTAFIKVEWSACFNAEIKQFICFQSQGMRSHLDLITFSLEKKPKTSLRLAFTSSFTTKAILVWEPTLKCSHVSLHSCFHIIPYIASDLSCIGQNTPHGIKLVQTQGEGKCGTPTLCSPAYENT